MPKRVKYDMIMAIDWPDQTFMDDDQWDEAQKDYYHQTREDKDPESIDGWSRSRRKVWNVLWHRRDRAQDAQLRAQGVETQLLEKHVEKVVKQKKRKQEAGAAVEERWLLAAMQDMHNDNHPKTSADEIADQKEAMRMFRYVKFARAMAATGTWPLTLTTDATDAADKVGQWFAGVQVRRCLKNHEVYLGNVACTGYSGYNGAMKKPDHNQRLVRCHIVRLA